MDEALVEVGAFAMSVLLVGLVGVASGFRSTGASPPEWLAAFGLLALFALALTWVAVGMSPISPNAEAASNNAMPLLSLLWCPGLAVLGYFWSKSVFNRDPK